jgi:hypothetical protein
MGKGQTGRLRPAQIQPNKDNFAALKAISSYAPATLAYKTDVIGAVETEITGS